MPWLSRTLRRGSRTPRSVKDVSEVTFYCLSGMGVWAALTARRSSAAGTQLRFCRSARSIAAKRVLVADRGCDVLASFPDAQRSLPRIPHPRPDLGHRRPKVAYVSCARPGEF